MESKTYSQKVDEWLFEKSGCHTIDFCRKFGYYPLALKIMALDENDEKKSKSIIARDAELKAHYIMCSKDPKSVLRKGQNRSWTRYFKDLITGWVIEDLCMEMLKQQGVEIFHNGRDAQRKIGLGNCVTTDADFCIKVGDVVRKVEMTNELNTFLVNEGYIEKRAPALYKLWKGKGIWVYRDLLNGKYVLIDFATEKVRLHLRRHNHGVECWAKDVHRYVLEENGKKARNDRMLVPELISVVGCSIEGKETPPLEEVIDADSPPQDWDIGGVRKNSTPSPEEERPERKAVVAKGQEKTGMAKGEPIKNSIQRQSLKVRPAYDLQATPPPPMGSLYDDSEDEIIMTDDVQLGDDEFI